MPNLDSLRTHPVTQTIAGTIAATVAVVGLFVLTDAVGRVQRNETWLFAVSIAAVVAGTAVLVGAAVWLGSGSQSDEETAGRMTAGAGDPEEGAATPGGELGEGESPSSATAPEESPTVTHAASNPGENASGEAATKPIVRSAVVVVGLALIASGLCLATFAAIKSGAASERPVATLAYDPEAALPLTATVRVENLASDKRVVVMVDGLGEDSTTRNAWRPHTLYQAYIGPDSNGSVNQQIRLPLPDLKRFAAVGVKAYTGSRGAQFDDTPCADYPRQVATRDQADRLLKLGPGCVIMDLPKEADESK